MPKEITEIILEELREHRRESSMRHEKMDHRVRKIEDWQSNANGKITMLGAIGVFMGGIVTWLTKFIYK